jgi:hypothetical protein
MSAGAGIFWGLVFVGLIVLYIFTRDRWKWRQVLIRAVLGVIVLAGVTTVCLFGYSSYQNRIVSISEFLGVKLSDKKADVKFKKGTSPSPDESFLAYKDKDGNWELVVRFRNEKVRMVEYVGVCSYCNHLNGLGIGTSYDAVLEKLGEPTLVSTSNDGLMRLLSFSKTNQFFQLAEGKVIGFGIYDPSTGPIKFSEEQREKTDK